MIAERQFIPSRAVISALVEAGIQAPSADNQHRVRFRILGDGIAMHAEASYLECEVAHRRLLTLISFGAIIENIRLKLTEYGRTFVPRWFPEATDPSLIIRIRWDELTSVESADRLVRHIDGRHTNRRFFRGPKATLDEREIIETAARIPGVVLDWFDQGAERRTLLRLIRRAETERFASEFLHKELFESIDFAAGWKQSTAERLAPGSLEVEAPLRTAFQALRRWPTMRAANFVGAHHVLGIRAGDVPARTSPHLCVLSSSQSPIESAVSVGVAFQRLWLAAQSLNLALQPMVASAILMHEDDESQGLSRRTRVSLQKTWNVLLRDRAPLVVFRLGRARPPRIRSGRKPIASCLDGSD